MKHRDTEKNLKAMANRFLGSHDLSLLQEDHNQAGVDGEIFTVLHTRYEETLKETQNRMNLAEAGEALGEVNDVVSLASDLNGILGIFSIAFHALVATVSGAISFITTGLRALWEIFFINKETSQRKIRIITALGTLCLSIIGLIIILGYLAISIFAFPAVLAGLMGLTIFKEQVIYKENIKSAKAVEEKIKIDEDLLSKRVEFVIKNNPAAEIAQQKLIAEQNLVQEEKNVSPERSEQLKENVDRKKANLAKILYEDNIIKDYSKKIDTNKRDLLALKIKAKYANQRKKSAIFGLLGAAVLVASIFIPVIAALGIVMLAISSYEYQGAIDKESHELESLASLSEEKPPLIAQLDHLNLVEHKLREKEKPRDNISNTAHATYQHEPYGHSEQPITPEQTQALNNLSTFHHSTQHSHPHPHPNHTHPETPLTCEETEALNHLSTFHHATHSEPKPGFSEQELLTEGIKT